MTALAIFDVDGTLIDSQDHIVAAMVFAFAELELEAPPRADILSIVGLSLEEAFATLSPELPAMARRDLAEHYRAAFVRHRSRAAIDGEAPLFPGARGLLDRLKVRPGTKLGIATGKARRGVDHLYRVHDLAGHFVTAQTADNHPSKPHPSMILAAVKEAEADPRRTVMIGDTEFDIAMARAAGVASIGVSWGYHPVDRLERAGADVLVGTFEDLETALNDALEGGV